MDDLINRQAVIDKINERQRKLIYCFGFENDAVKIMDIAKSIVIAIPSAQPEPQWIPCHDPSDLPKDKRIWITREYEAYGFRDVSNVIWDMTEWSDNVSGVVAYMPYIEPEPYEERRTDE